MNFLTIVQKIDAAIGSQGDVISVESSGYQALLSEYARNAWILIQNLRKDWDFLRTSVDINLTVGKTDYSIFDIFGTSVDPVSMWKTDSFIYNYNPLKEIHYDDYLRLDTTSITATEPSFFVRTIEDHTLIFNEPDAAYTVTASYYQQSQQLLINSDVPLCPEEHQWAIIYQAASDLCLYLSIPELYTSNETKAKASIGALLRSQNPAKRAKKRRGIA